MHSVTGGTRLPVNRNSGAGGNRRAASTSGSRNNRNRRRHSEDPAVSASNVKGSAGAAVNGNNDDGGRRSTSAQGGQPVSVGGAHQHRPTRIPLGRRSGGDGMESSEDTVSASTRGRSKLPTSSSNSSGNYTGTNGIGNNTGNMVYNNNSGKPTSVLTSSNANHINSSTRNNNINNNVGHIQYICGDGRSGATTTTNTTTPRRGVSRQGKAKSRPANLVNGGDRHGERQGERGINQNEEDLTARESPPPLPSLIFSGGIGEGGEDEDTGAARLIGSDPDGEQFRCDVSAVVSPQDATYNGNCLDYNHGGLPSPVIANTATEADHTSASIAAHASGAKQGMLPNGNGGTPEGAAAAVVSAEAFFTSTTNTTAESLHGAFQDKTSITRHKDTLETGVAPNANGTDFFQRSTHAITNTSSNIPLVATGYRGGGRGLVSTSAEGENGTSSNVVLSSNISNSIRNGADETSAHHLTNSVISNDIVNQRLCSSSSFHGVSNVSAGDGERGAVTNSNNDRTNSISCFSSSFSSDKRQNNTFNGNVQLQQLQRSQLLQYQQPRFHQQQLYQVINSHPSTQQSQGSDSIEASCRTARYPNTVFSRSISGNNNTNCSEDQKYSLPIQGEQITVSGLQNRSLSSGKPEIDVTYYAVEETTSMPGHHLVRSLKKNSDISPVDGTDGSQVVGSTLHESMQFQRQESSGNLDSNKRSPVHRGNVSGWSTSRRNLSADACNELASDSTRLDDSFVRLPAVRKSPSFPQMMASSINSYTDAVRNPFGVVGEQSKRVSARGSGNRCDDREGYDGANVVARNKDSENHKILSKLSPGTGMSCVENFQNSGTTSVAVSSDSNTQEIVSHVMSPQASSFYGHGGGESVEQAVSEGRSSVGGQECPVEAASVASNGSSLNDFLDSAADGNDGGSSTGGAEFSSGHPTRPSSRNNGHHPTKDEQQVEEHLGPSQERDNEQQQQLRANERDEEEEEEDESSNCGSNPLQQHIQQQILQHQQQYIQQQQQKRHQSAGPVINSRGSHRSSHRLSRSASRSSGIPPPPGAAPSPLTTQGIHLPLRAGQQTPLTILSAPALDNPAEIAAFIATLRKERSRLLQEIEGEESERCQYNSRLDALSQRLSTLGAQGLQQSAEARGVEGEIRRLREVGLHRLGSPGFASRRRHHRLHAINTIEKTIQRLHHLPIVDNHSTSAYSAPGGVVAPENQPRPAPDPPNSRYWPAGRRSSSDYSQRQDSVSASYVRLTASEGCPQQTNAAGQTYDNDVCGNGNASTNTAGDTHDPLGQRRRLSDTSVTSADLTSSLYSRSFASDSSELSSGELRKHLSISQTFQNHCIEPSLSSRRYQLGSEFVPALYGQSSSNSNPVTSQLEYNNSEQANHPYPQSDYLNQLNSSAHPSYSDNPPQSKHGKHSQCDRQSPCSSTANGTWYEHLPRSNQKPPLQFSRRPPLQREKGNHQRLYYPSDQSRAGYPPHFVGRSLLATNKLVMDVANANSQMLDVGSTADEVSDIPSSNSASLAHHSMEPDSLDSGIQHHHHSGTADGTYTNGDSPHTYDDANGGHYSNGHHGEDDTTFTGEQEGGYGDGEDIPRLPSAIEAVLRGVWPFEKALWHSSPATVGLTHSSGTQADPPGIMATSSVTSRRAHSQQQLLTNKVEMVYGLLSMFSSGDRAEMSKTLLAMSSSPDSCLALRQSGCLPLLIQLLHGGCEGGDLPSREARLRASQALHNVVHANADEKRGRREARVLRLLEQIRAYSDYLFERLERTGAGQGPLLEDDMDRHPCPAMAAVMKLSFDEEHRLAMCTLGGLHAIAELVKRDHEAHGATTPDNFCITLRRYAGMALTNLTFGAGSNKALVCSFGGFLKSLVAQLNSPSQDLRQVTSSVIRNLSWRADSSSKQALREAGAVGGLMRAALTASKEATLKVILSAVWNLSAHCSVNKAEICAVDGALAFICSSLTYKSQSRTLAIVENAGGILRNISSHIAVREDLRQVLRDHSTLSVILSQLRSPSLTVVSNACGTLWNLSARCQQDQQALWDLGAVPMLRSLINSKHKMISMGSSAALKNLLQAKPEGASLSDSKHGLRLPTLQARRQKALEQELDPSLAETCDNIESSPRASPTNVGLENNFFGPGGGDLGGLYGRPMYHSLDPRYGGVVNNGVMTESRDSVHSNHSTRSDNTHDRMQHLLGRQPNGSSNGHRPADLALRNVNRLSSEEVQEVQTERNGLSNGSSNEQLNSGERSNSAPNTSRTVHPSDPLYSLYNKYVAHNRGTTNRKDSRHGKSSEEGSIKTAKGSENGSKNSSTSNLLNGDAKPNVKVDNFVGEPTGESDNVDQPTDFSLRYSEEEDPNKVRAKGDKPVKRVKPNSDKGSGGEEEEEEPEEEYLGADDSVQTYFTEGTPLNFSTATSLTDLREQGGGGAGGKGGRLGTQQEVEEEEASTPLADCADAADCESGEEDQKEDDEEGGGRLSRFSSLSSISSGEISAGHEDELEEDSDLQELVLAEGGRVAAAAARAAQQQDDVSPRQDDDGLANGHHDQDTEWSAGVTPLMFSRTTSLGSLSSFPHQAPLDDTGSVLSEFSRLASGAVSPSDLPDSPSQTMPPSPRRRTPQHPQPSNTQTGQYGSSLGVFNDAPQHFNEEGTPCILSRGTSLSSLTMDDTPTQHRQRGTTSLHGSTNSSSCQPPLASAKRVRGDGKDSSANTSNTPNSPALPRQQQVASLQAGPGGAGRGRSLTPRTSSIPRPASLGQDHERSRSSDPHAALSPSGDGSGVRGRPKEKRHQGGDADGEKLLAACINSGMPNRRSCDPTKPVSRSHSFVKSPRTPTLGAPPIPPPPPPPPPPRLMGDSESWGLSRVSNIPINTANLQVTTTALNLQPQGGGGGWGAVTGDTLRTYCTEDTPAILSQAGSVSDLSQLSMEGGRALSSIATPRRPLGPSHGLLLQGDHTDSSSDTEGILDRCIQAAMPKLRSIKGKPLPPRHNYGIPPSPRLVQPMIGGKPPSGSNPQSPSGTYSPAPPTALPRRPSASPHYSPRHRPVPVARVSPAMKPPAPVDRQSPPSDAAKTMTNGLSNGKLIHDSEEEVKNWGEVEGTPLGFSTATSLSDLTVDSCDPDPPQASKKTSNLPRADTPKRYATEGTPAIFSRCDSLSSLSCEDESGQLTSKLSGAPPQRQLSKIPGHKNSATAVESDEVPRQFNVEDTPAMLSRRSSLSSIDGVACSEPDAAGKSSQQTPGEASGPCNFGVEGTPAFFSRNSSLSSLSVESYPEETTPSEQALLQHCINQGMPRREQRLSRGSAGRGNKRGKSGSRIPGMTQSPGRSPARSPARNIPGVAMQRLQLVPITASRSSEAGGSNTEAESSKLSTDIEQSEKSQMEATSTPYLEDDESLIDDITEVTEPVSDVTTAPIAEVLAARQSSSRINGACALVASSTSTGGASSSPEEKQSSGDETRGSSGRGYPGAEKGSWGSGHGIGSDVSMTDSMIVATEALRVARAVEVHGQDGRSSDDASIMSQSITSEGLLENIAAPSAMESVMSLSNSLNDDPQRSQQPLQRKSIECRHTRKLPTMVRRALGDQEMSEINGMNGGSLASSCHSNLDNVVPPSFMEADDMESSMISVASITSEVAESRHSPPSLTSSIPSEAMAAIEAPAQQLARMFMREARQQASSMTLTAGDDTSTCQEVTELDRDETLGPHDTTTDTDLAVDDMPPDIPDLPHDSPLHRAKNSPQVTPSMLRKAVHNNDRFRKFSKGEKLISPQSSVEGASRSDGSSKPIVSPRSSLTPKQKRSEQADRFRTRTISTEDDQEPDTPTTPTAENQMGSPQQRRSMREKRQTNPARYQTRTIENGANGRQEEEGLVEFRDGAELDLTAEQLEALSQDANIVICTLNENREANTADLLHGLSQENILDIETLSLISSDEEDNTFDVETPNSPVAPGRPRILKPGEASLASFQQDEEEAACKGIRGRRKGLYPGARKAQASVKPTQQPAVARPVVPTPAAAFKPTPRTLQQPVQQHPPTPSPPSQLQQPGSPKLPRTTRTSELRLKVGRLGSSSSSSPASSAGSSPRMGATSRPRQPPPQTHVTAPVLKRQNTFTKEDLEEQEQQQQQAISRTGSKPRYRKDAIQPSPMMSARQISKTGEGVSGQPKSFSLTRDARPPSATDMADWNKDSKTGKAGKKDVTSRIASLWKKVEKAQATSKPKENDARVWISKTKSKAPEPSSPPPLVRSSTYEKLTVGGESRSDSERNDSSKTKTRLGLKLSRLRGRDTKSSPPSEVGTPVDTRPQCLVSPSRSSGSSTPRGKMSLPGPGSRPHQASSSSSGADGQGPMISADGKRLSRLGSFIVVDGEEDAATGGASGVAGATVMRSPQSAVVAPFNYQPPGSCSSPAGSRSSSISSGSQRRLQGGDERGVVSAGTNASTRIPLPKSVVMSNNPRDDNGNAPFV